MQDKRLHNLENKISYRFRNIGLLRQALTHSSYANEHKGIKNYERLEYLGDSIIQMTISEWLFRKKPEMTESAMTTARTNLVCENALYECAMQIGLADCIILGNGMRTDKQIPKSILADTVESLSAAIYLDSNIDAVKKFIYNFILTDIEVTKDSKTILQEMLGNQNHELRYAIIEESGKDNEKSFTAAAFFNDKMIGQGAGQSKKMAEQAAAADAIQGIHQIKTI